MLATSIGLRQHAKTRFSQMSRWIHGIAGLCLGLGDVLGISGVVLEISGVRHEIGLYE